MAKLRADRRRRVFATLDDQGLDALVLGRPSNVAYASGARTLWHAGTRPFGPACVVVAATGRVHLAAYTDHGVPPEIPREDLLGMTWNPSTRVEALAAIPGLDVARRVGTDGFS